MYEKNIVFKNNADAHSQGDIHVGLLVGMFPLAIRLTCVYAFTSAAQE